jgi:5-dehydro-2-deoxygluconokinase
VDADPVLRHLHRTTAARKQWPELCVMALDHRSQFLELAREAGADEGRLPALKHLLVEAAAQVEQSHSLQGQVGVLVDDRYGADALASATGRGWWVGRPVELPGSRPLRFDHGPSVASELKHWPAEQVIKCLVHYHPDDPAPLRLEQELQVQHLWQAALASGHELLLEIIPPPSVTPPGQAEAAVLRSVKRFYNLGVKPDWWKLAPMSAAGWDALGDLVAQRDPHCRGVVILGLNQPLAALADGFTRARHPIVKGFMVGRSLWAEPALAWLKGEIDDAGLQARAAENFAMLVDAWRGARVECPA